MRLKFRFANQIAASRAIPGGTTWPPSSNLRYAGTDEEDWQNPTVAHLMADDLLLSYVGDGEVTEVFNEIRRG